MTNGTDESRKSLKDQNRWQLWVIVVANSLFLYGVVKANAIAVTGLRAAFTDIQSLIPVGLALVITTVLNGVISAETKARLVFLRWHDVLPGHRAFSIYAMSDPRVDRAALIKLHGGPLPVNPVEQNQAWYRIYKAVENAPAVRQVHRDFLLLRDYTALSTLLILIYGTLALYVIRSKEVAAMYLVFLVLQYAVVRHAASNYGIRFVTTVLAQGATISG
jgi:hypothetical protein